VVSHLDVDPARVVTVYNGVDRADRTDIPSHDGMPYALYVGGHERRKNLATVFQAMAKFWSAHGFVAEMRLTGRLDSLQSDARTAFDRLPPNAPVRFLGFVDDEALERLYRQAALLILLSKDEGFGLPVLEAMAHGCPVLAANRASLPEVVGDAGVLVDADDANAAANAIHMLLDDQRLRERLINAGKTRARHWSWEQTARRIRTLYEPASRLHEFPRDAMARSPVRMGAAS
jgi:glycosyltransferase involved in cell wall biosynthesis